MSADRIPAPVPPADLTARHAAERYLESVIADAMVSYGEANWRHDLAPALAARFQIYWDYNGPNHRLMLCGPWEWDVEAHWPHTGADEFGPYLARQLQDPAVLAAYIAERGADLCAPPEETT